MNSTVCLKTCSIVMLLLATGSEYSTCRSQERWVSGSHTLICNGLQRKFLLDVPADLKPGSALVLVFHGYTDSAAGIRRAIGLTALSQQHGFVVAYPEGTRDSRGNTFFNVGYQFHADQTVDDIAFTRHLVERLATDLKLDTKKVYATGMSNGGDMSFLLATQQERLVAAIAPVAGTMMSSWGTDFVPRHRVPVLAVHGTADQVTLWNGDPENRDGWGAYLSVDAVMDRWVKGLQLEHSEVRQLPNSAAGKVSGVRHKRWWTATDSTEVVLYELTGGGHDLPQNLSDELATAATIWRFFASHKAH